MQNMGQAISRLEAYVAAEKQVNNQVSMSLDPTQISTPSSSTPLTSEVKSAEQVHKPTTPFLNGLGVIIMHNWKKYLRSSIK